MKCFGKPDFIQFFIGLFFFVLIVLFMFGWTILCVVVWFLTLGSFRWECWDRVFNTVMEFLCECGGLDELG